MEIKDSILKTICFFDLRDFPLTLREVTDYLWEYKATENEVRKKIRKMLGRELSRKGEFYFLKNRDEVVKIRRERQKIAIKKWRRAKRAISFLRVVPYIKGIAVAQSLAINNCKEASDADIWIVASPGRVWIVRAFINIFLDIFRKRNPQNKNRICPSFYVTKNKMDIREIAIKPYDIDLVYIIKTIKPIFGIHYFYEFEARNFWTSIYLSNLEPNFTTQLLPNPFLWSIKKILEIILWPFSKKLERVLKNKQIEILERNKKKAKNPSIVTSDDMIKIHYDDKRKFYLEKWQEKVKEIK